MDWTTMPLEIFSGIVLWLEPQEVVNLESICKSWKDFASSQPVWQAICFAAQPGLVKWQNIPDWRGYALKSVVIMRNMKLNRCVVRPIRVSSWSGYHQIIHRCMLSGDELLIAAVHYAATSSYSSTYAAGNTILNLNTGEETEVEDLKATNLLLMKNYMINSGGSCSMDHFEADNTILILNRSTKKKTTMERIGNRYKFTGCANVQMNDNHEFNTFLLFHFPTNSFYVVDAEKTTWKEFKIDPINPSKNLVNAYQLHGKYLAYSQLRYGYNNEERLMYLIVLDTETGETILSEKTDQFVEWSIAEDRIVLADHFRGGVKWVLKSFSGKIISQYKTEKQSEKKFLVSLVKLFSNFIVLLKNEQFYFFDAITPELLCCLKLSKGVSDGGRLLLSESGKLLYIHRNATQIIDFEARSLSKKVRVKVLQLYDGTDTAKISFSEIMRFSSERIGEHSIGNLASVLIHHDEAANERMSMIYLALKKPENENLNFRATQYLTNMGNKLTVNMSAHEFVDEALDGTENFSHSRGPLNKQVMGPAVVYKEKLVDGQWVPVDME